MALVLVTLALIEQLIHHQQHLYHLIFVLLSPRCTIRIGTEHGGAIRCWKCQPSPLAAPPIYLCSWHVQQQMAPLLLSLSLSLSLSIDKYFPGKISGENFRGKFPGKISGENCNSWGKIEKKIYGKICQLDGFSIWEKLIWVFFMGKSTILVIELFHLKMGKIS